MPQTVAEPGAANRVIAMFEHNRDLLTPEEFLRLSPDERANILRSRIVAPDFDRADFGMLEVEYRIPRFAL
jgi:hypothetical protein